jgi:raffinose/stachyose/melibiose transport system substrate-binding protein/xylobiose transport system substrate-binding protein
MTDPKYVKGMINAGQVPAIKGLQDEVHTGKFADYNTYSYNVTLNAPAFTQSWDQALPADLAQTMLTNIQKVFNKQMSPEQFAKAMEAAS